MDKISELELARQAFLLTVCERNAAPVDRHYLAEKVNTIYRCRHVWEVNGLLDLASQRIFYRILRDLGGNVESIR